MRHTHLFSKLSLAIAVIATVGICQSSFSSPAPIGPIIIAEEAPAPPMTIMPSSEPFTFAPVGGDTTLDFVAPPQMTQQSEFFPMIWSWMQMYPAWAGFFCVAILCSLVYFLQTMMGVSSTEDAMELADSFVEEKATFSRAMPEVEVHEDEMQEQSYEDSYSSTTETESQTEEPRVPVSQLD